MNSIKNKNICSIKCPIKLLYKNVKHYHDRNDIIIHKNNNMFNKLIINNKRYFKYNY